MTQDEAPPGAPATAPLTMFSPLSAIVRAEPLVVPLQATVGEALLAMDRLGRGAVVVAGADRIPLGIFTLRDVLRRVTLAGRSLSGPVAAVMTAGLITLRTQATAHQAALALSRHRVGRVVVVDGEGRLVGVVTRGDLFGLRRVGVEEVSARLAAATDLAGLQEAAAAIRGMADSLLAQGLSAETLTHQVSTLHDLLTIRLLEVVADVHELPPVPTCWVAMGSEGRMEQTRATDQDNALVFEAAPSDAAAVREALLPFARAANEWLAACGFPLCQGEAMARNPRWCLSLDEWNAAFGRWIAEPTPQAILDSTIALDLRPLWGSEVLVERMRETALARVAPDGLFVRLHAEAALEARPPLGRIRDFRVDRSGEHRHTLDLKRFGSRIFADVARVLALRHRVPQTSTAERMRAVAGALRLSPEELAALVDAFYFVHRLRLRLPARHPGDESANRVDPRTLHQLDRFMLREALRQAGKLQRCLALELRLE